MLHLARKYEFPKQIKQEYNVMHKRMRDTLKLKRATSKNSWLSENHGEKRMAL